MFDSLQEKLRWLRPRRARAAPLIAGDPFAIDARLAGTIQREITAKTAPHTPTESQWEMILSKSRNTVVNAGAGSGKSTSLVLRILVLHHYLGIPLGDITVFSFTRASTEEFRQKLQTQFLKWNIKLSDDDTRTLVRTFHSKLLAFEPKGKVIFEFLSEDDNEDAPDTLVGIADLNVSRAQNRYLYEAYATVYADNAAFRGCISRLHTYSIRQKYLTTKKELPDWQVSKVLRNDYELTKSLLRVFPGYAMKGPKALTVEVDGRALRFFANLYFRKHDTYAIFVPGSIALGERAEELVENMPIGTMLYVKARFLALHSDKDVRFIHTAEEKEALMREMRTTQANEADAPKFRFAPDGIKSDWIWKSLYSEAQFIEGAAVSVDEYTAYTSELSNTNKDFAECLQPFWNELNQQLEAYGIARFGEFFLRRSDRVSDGFKSVPYGVLRSMKHVIIDEFQDISPEIVSWVRGTLATLRDRGIATSLMCVGDDWQSIYGWRNSSPHYITSFEKHFPSHDVNQIALLENFRSYQQIIDHAERVMEAIQLKSRKHGFAQRQGTGFLEFRATETRASIIAAAKDLLNKWTTLPISEKNEGSAIYVLARTNSALSKAQNAIQDTLETTLFRFETIHRSKGLEADFCLLIGDCEYRQETPTRNLVYGLANFPQTYDQAQQDEAMRLAYVAITRARYGVIWLAKAKDGGAFELVRR